MNGFNRLPRQSPLPVIGVRGRRCRDRHCYSNERRLAAVAFIAVTVLIVSTVSAQGSAAHPSDMRRDGIAHPGQPTRGTLVFRTGSEKGQHEAPLLKTDVRMTIS